MEYKSTLDIYKNYFDKQVSLQKEKSIHKIDYAEPFITISKETGCGGFYFANLLINYLNENDHDAKKNWVLFDKNIIEKVINEHELKQELARFMPEKKISEMQAVIEQLFGLHPSEQKLIRKISSTILHLAVFGNVVLMDRASNIITKELSGGLHIRLIKSLDKRIQNVERRLNVDKHNAIKFVENGDKDKSDYVKKYFSKRIDDQSLYSLIINLDIISIEEAIQMIGTEIIYKRKYLLKRILS